MIRHSARPSLRSGSLETPRTRRPFAFPKTSAQTAPVSGNAGVGLGGLWRACTSLGGSAGSVVVQQGERGYLTPSCELGFAANDFR